MRQFNLEEYLKNPDRKVMTRNGKPARIICTDKLGDKPVVALILSRDGKTETTNFYTSDGICLRDDIDYPEDLMFAPTKKEGWINLFKINSTITSGEIYNTKEEAKSAVVGNFIYISTVKIEWEE